MRETLENALVLALMRVGYVTLHLAYIIGIVYLLQWFVGAVLHS